MNIGKKLIPVFESRVGTKYRVDEEYEYGNWKTVFEDENGEHWKDIPGLGGMTNIGREEPGYNSDYTIHTQTRDLQ